MQFIVTHAQNVNYLTISAVVLFFSDLYIKVVPYFDCSREPQVLLFIGF